VAKFRNITADRRRVGYGFVRAQVVEPDCVLTTPDDDAVTSAYACQPDIWRPEDKAAQAAADRLGVPTAGPAVTGGAVTTGGLAPAADEEGDE
jgi:hypothetical protein